MGGTLSRPHERFPKYFDAPFWKEYPYFLPCLATSSFMLIIFVITLCLFKEVSRSPPPPIDDNQLLNDLQYVDSPKAENANSRSDAFQCF